jgi:diacylglycerol kinase family enzyme
MADTRHQDDHPMVILVNPNSTAAAAGVTEYAIRRLTPFGVRAVLTTQGRGHAAELATLATQEHGALTVVTLGGDGTAAEAAGALVGTGTALAPMPTGSTNVFARTLGWPTGAREAVDRLVGAIQRGQRADEVTIGRLEWDGDGGERFFIVNAGAGLDAEAAHIVERNPQWKRRVGQLWFAAATAYATLGQSRRGMVRVSIDGGTPFPLASLSVACSRPYTYMRNRAFDLIPEAGIPGALGWMGATTAGPRAPALAIAGALTGAWHLDSRVLAHGTARTSIVMESDVGVALQADGEPLGRHRRVVLRPAPGLLVLRGDAGD